MGFESQISDSLPFVPLRPLQLRSAPSSGFLLQNSQSTLECKLAKINFYNIQWTFFNILTLSKFGEGIGPLVMQFIWNTFLISYCFICSLTVQLWIQNYRHLGYCWLKKSFHNGQGLLPKHSIQPESQNFCITFVTLIFRLMKLSVVYFEGLSWWQY